MNTMQRTIVKVLSIGCLMGLGTVMITLGVWAWSTYNPYPPGILPQDLDSEIARVQREITFIFNEALKESKTLPPPNLQGNPPTLQGSGYQSVEVLGKLMNFDLNMSPFKNVACSSCHMPYAAFSGPIPSVNLTMIAYPGTFHFRAGKRTAQRYTYSPDFPVLEFNTTQGAFFGGNFWDARATGNKLQSPDAQQAQGPPVDTQEMGFPDTACIAFRLSTAVYRPLFETVWGADFDINFSGNTEQICDTPGGAAVFGGSATPIQLSPQDRTKANNVYDHWGQSISFYERSDRLSPFTSKFDAFLKGTYTLTGKATAIHAISTEDRPRSSRAKPTPAPGLIRGPCSQLSAMPISACRSTPGMLSFTRPSRMPPGLPPIH
jgi:cytochrome c peroxidase